MKVANPGYPKLSLNQIFILFLVLTVFWMIPMQIVGNKLVTSEAPAGIVSFELAGSLQSAEKIMSSWKVEGMRYAILDMGLDFLFILLYTITLISGSILVARKTGNPTGFLGKMGFVIAFFCMIAGILDLIENYALIEILMGDGRDSHATIAFWAAIPKFIFAGLGILYILIGGLYVLFTRTNTHKQPIA